MIHARLAVAPAAPPDLDRHQIRDGDGQQHAAHHSKGKIAVPEREIEQHSGANQAEEGQGEPEIQCALRPIA